MSSMINLKASRKTPTITVGVNPITNISVSPSSEPTSKDSAMPRATTSIVYPPVDNAYPSVMPQCSTTNENISNFSTDSVLQNAVLPEDPEKAALMREIQVLRTIIELQHSNPILVNKYIIII